MPQQTAIGVENSFVGGLKTEFTGLNYPEHATVDTDNCTYTLIGNVIRRGGIDFETNYQLASVSRTNKALSTYKWDNAGGDGNTQVVVEQIGDQLFFFESTNSTLSAGLSSTLLATGVALDTYTPAGGTAPDAVECQYTSGNGYLFVFHPLCDPFYCTFTKGTPSTIASSRINVQIRDFVGIPEAGVLDSTRPASLSDEHLYNIRNQGWSNVPSWTASDFTSTRSLGVGSVSFTVETGLSITPGQTATAALTFYEGGDTITRYEFGTVTSYNSGSGALVLNITQSDYTNTGNLWIISHTGTDHIDAFFTTASSYPSNADVWWIYKDSTGAFAPATTLANFTLGSAPAPKGHHLLDAFNQDRATASGIAALTTVSTIVRPRTGTWFQGRVWYTGIDASFSATGDAPYTTWSEYIYFSQIVETAGQFGKCYQVNDPTDENSFDLLPTDGGTIRIQGCGSVYKLFPVQNGLLIFAANGIWFITGSQGIGFSANDYTITKISGVRSFSGTSFVNVFGWPMFWNEEGIYTVNPSEKGGGLEVNNLCIGTILDYYADIPLISKKYARGDFDPINYIVTWCFRSENESSVMTRYEFDKMLNLNTVNKAFFPYSISPADSNGPYIHDIRYVASPGGDDAPEPGFRYLISAISAGSNSFSFAEEKDRTHFVDFYTYNSVGSNYSSYFTTGYALHGKAILKWQPIYVNMFSNNEVNTAYKIQGHWDFSVSGNSGKWSTVQVINNTADTDEFSMLYRRHKIRGHGLALQIKVASVDGEPFDILGWSIFEGQNTSV